MNLKTYIKSCCLVSMITIGYALIFSDSNLIASFGNFRFIGLLSPFIVGILCAAHFINKEQEK